MKKLISFLLIFLLCVSLYVPATASDSSVADVPSSWAKEIVEEAIAKGLVPENLQQNYGKPISRGNIAKMLANLIELSSGKTEETLIIEQQGTEIPYGIFTDTEDFDIRAAYCLGIISGTGDGKFSPERTLTRAQIATIVNKTANVLGVKTEGYTHSFTDVKAHWSNTQLGWPSKKKIISGYPDGSFKPDKTLTTEQAIVIFYQTLQALDPAKIAAAEEEEKQEETQGVITKLNGKTYYLPEGSKYTFDATGRADQPYLVAVNRQCCTVTVYGKDASGDYTSPVKAFVCSIGRSGHTTPTGRWDTTDKYEWRLMVDGTYGRYAIRFAPGGYLFHSVPYYSKNNDDLEYTEFNKLGEPASLGCVRMCVADVKWLYDNCPSGFTTIVYDDPNPGPLGKPEAVRTDVSDETKRGWDPTDPDPENPWNMQISK